MDDMFAEGHGRQLHALLLEKIVARRGHQRIGGGGGASRPLQDASIEALDRPQGCASIKSNRAKGVGIGQALKDVRRRSAAYPEGGDIAVAAGAQFQDRILGRLLGQATDQA